MKLNRLNRREPLSRFALTMGAADMVIGGVGHSTSLFLLGLTTAGIGLLVRWARLKPRSPSFPPSPGALTAAARSSAAEPHDPRRPQSRSSERRIY